MNEDIEDLRDEVWSAMLTADYNSRYWEYLYKRYYQRQKWAEIFLAVTSSSSVAAWGIWSSTPLVWKLLSAASTLVAVTLPIINMKKQIADLADLLSQWVQIHAAYCVLWFDIEHTQPSRDLIIDQFKKLQGRETEVDKTTSNIPDDDKLLEKCRQEVLASRNNTSSNHTNTNA
jgi:hypothetical protein